MCIRDSFNWKLVGKKEMYIPYNSYRLINPELSYKDVHQKGHLNQDYTRYELHRVWEIEATLADGKRHSYSRRVFYIDEDSWGIAVKDQYDGQGNLWRVGESHMLQLYQVDVPWTATETNIDLNDGRYLTLGLTNEERGGGYTFGEPMRRRDYETSALRRLGKR